jgi:hypothetical protein
MDFGQAENLLGNLGTAAIPEGLSAEGEGLGYDLSLLSGNRAAQDATIAPEVNAAVTGANTARRELSSSGTARGGGVNAALQQAGDIPTTASVDAITKLLPSAAGRAESAGGNIVGQGEGATSTVAGNELTHRGQTLSFISNLLNTVASLKPGGGGAQSSAPSAPPPAPIDPQQIPSLATSDPSLLSGDIFNSPDVTVAGGA